MRDQSLVMLIGPPVVIPSVRNLDVLEARRRLACVGFREITEKERPSDGTPAGQVMQTNPRSGVVMCGRKRILLYVAEPELMPNLLGLSIADVRKRAEANAFVRDRLSLASCRKQLPGDADAQSRLIVRAQEPVSGTPVDASLSGKLQLTTRDDFWRDFVGRTVAEAREQLRSLPILSGWSFQDVPTIVDNRRILSAYGDRDTCRLVLVLAPVVSPPRTSEIRASAPQDSPSMPSLAVAIPLTAAATLVGLLAFGRLLFGSSDPGSNGGAPPSPTPPGTSAWRVSCDAPFEARRFGEG